MKKLPDLMMPQEVADIFRVSVRTVKKWEKSDGLRPIRLNSRGDRRYKKKMY